MNGNGIGWAVKQVQDGQRVARQGWNGKGMFLFLIAGSEAAPTDERRTWTYTDGKQDNYPVRPFVAMKTATGDVVPWLCSQTDLLATDWTQVP